MTPLMIVALCDHPCEKPSLYLDEIAIIFWDEFQIMVTTSSIRRAIVAKGSSKKSTRQSARGQNASYEIILYLVYQTLNRTNSCPRFLRRDAGLEWPNSPCVETNTVNYSHRVGLC